MANLRATNGAIPAELQTRLNDLDMQHALGFLTSFSRQWGRHSASQADNARSNE